MITNQFDDRYAESIKSNVRDIKERVEKAARKCGRDPKEIQIMAVTKTVEPEYVNIAIGEGITLIGENKAQEFNSKYEKYDLDGENIHFIGHLQRNKVKTIIDKVSMIESVDSVSLAKEINKQALKLDKIMPILIEINIGKEEGKSGFYKEDIEEACKEISKMSNIKIKGLMSIPPKDNIDYYFEENKQIYVDISGKKLDNVNMDYLSMGMSGDFEAAILHGANIIRIGTSLFGKRYYNMKK